jgi:hypothetical protein
MLLRRFRRLCAARRPLRPFRDELIDPANVPEPTDDFNPTPTRLTEAEQAEGDRAG